MESIIVDPEQLEAIASRVESQNSDYKRIYQKLYAEVEKMNSSWSGKDNAEFTSRIKSYESDLRQISLVLNQYSDFLRASARAYRETQDEIFNNASRLKTGG